MNQEFIVLKTSNRSYSWWYYDNYDIIMNQEFIVLKIK
jgi:hypothetical protein